ncbi:MAG: amidophosphoribosyltransferase [Deltaproteobacteria bacterium]|nr:amidophosphoribosyltransferase [Deltaproteobacteria bacterium]MBW2071042.1 amidophosphoribosyltransferase [Deltaproteobacteria bacterium]
MFYCHHQKHRTNRPREECGVFGVYGHPDTARLIYFGLYALQHRGQESAGISVADGKRMLHHKGMGLVSEIFDENVLASLPGNLGIGHVRYSTTGSSMLINAQPFCITHSGCSLAIAHNGNLVNAHILRKKLENQGSIFQSTMDSEVIVHLIARQIIRGLEEALIYALSEIEGAYSLVLSTEKQLIAARDPYGFRPMCLGMIDNDAYVIASETCALDLIGACYLRDVEPGEVVFIDEGGLRSRHLPKASRSAFCIFEFIYFARPDSNIFGQNVYLARKRQGHEMAREYPVTADFVMPFPDSGNYAALGFAEASRIPLEMGVIRNHYVGRTFIQPTQAMRDFGVKVKLNPVRPLLKGKRLVIIEDSIIRGTTSRNRIKALREVGAKEVHMAVSCPPHRYPCHYGIDFPTRKELIAARHTVEGIRDFLELDSLHYLTLEGLLRAINMDSAGFCLACFNGNYPVSFSQDLDKHCMEVSSIQV